MELLRDRYLKSFLFNEKDDAVFLLKHLETPDGSIREAAILCHISKRGAEGKGDGDDCPLPSLWKLLL